MPKNVVITPASGLVEFKGNSGNTDATIQLDDFGGLNLTNPNGDISIGDTTSDVYIGDGITPVDIIFELDGSITALSGKTLTLGSSGSSVSFAGNVTSQIVSTVTTGTAPFSITSTTRVANLNADLLDGNDSTFFTNASNSATTTAQNAYNLANGTAIVANTDYTFISATAGVYGNSTHVPVTTLTANGRVSSITNTAISIAASQISSGTLPIARGGTNQTTFTNGVIAYDGTSLATLANTGTAGTYANASHVPVITTDAYGRVSAITNTAISFPVTSVVGTTGAISNNQILSGLLTVDGVGSGLDADLLDGFPHTAFANATFANTRFSSSGGSITGDVTVTGNLTIVGQTVYANTTTALIADNLLTLNAAINQASAPTVDAGVEVDRGSSANVALLWNETSDRWTFTNDGTTYFNIADAGRLDSSFTHANSAFNQANTATTTAQNAYNLANGTAGVANTDFTTLTASAGTYANASHVPVTTLTANGRVSSITNTPIAITTTAVSGVFGYSSGGTNATSYTTGQFITSNGTALVSVANTGTAGTYANASHVPVITTDAYGRVSGVTNTLISITSAQHTGVHNFALGGTNATSYTTGTLLTSNGTAIISLANTGTAATYANASHVPVITTDAYGRVSSVTNTAIAIDASAITSGTLPVARGGTGVTTSTGTGSVVLNTSPTFSGTITTGTGVGGIITGANVIYSNVFVANTNGWTSANVGTAGTYGNSTHVPVITTDAYGRVSGVTNTAIALAASAITSGTLPIARGGTNQTTYTTGAIVQFDGTSLTSLSNTGTAATYANATHVPVITTDAYGRVSSVTNTAISFPVTSVAGVTGAVSNTQLINGIIAVDGTGSGLDADLLDGLQGTSYANATFAQAAFDKANQSAQLAFTTVAANGINVVADANNDTLTLSAANGVGITADASSDTITINLTPTGVTSGTYGGATQIPTFVVDTQGRLTSASNVAISTNLSIAADTGLNSVALATDTLTFVGGDGITSSIGPADNVRFDVDNTVIRTSGNQTITGNLSITGNLNVVGNTIVSNVTSLVVNDPLIQLAANNETSDAIDIGFYGHYSDDGGTSLRHAGLFRDTSTSDKRFILFTNLIDQGLDNAVAVTVNTAQTSFATANLQTNIIGGRVSGLTQAIAIADGGTNATSFNTGNLIFFNGTSLAAIANTGTAGTYANASHVPVITTDAYGRVSSVTNTAISISASQISSGTLPIARGGTNQTTYTTGAALQFDGTSISTLANTGTAGTYANASHIPVITTDAYGRVSGVTNTPVQISTTQVTSGVLPFERGGANATSYTTGALLTSNGTAFVSLANTGTAGTYGNSTHVPVITTDAYGRVSSVSTSAITGGGGTQNVTISTFNTTANGTTLSYNLGFNPVAANAIFVSIDGVVQPESTYSVNTTANTITFGVEPGNTENVRVVAFASANPYIIADGSIDPSKLSVSTNNFIVDAAVALAIALG